MVRRHWLPSKVFWSGPTQSIMTWGNGSLVTGIGFSRAGEGFWLASQLIDKYGTSDSTSWHLFSIQASRSGSISYDKLYSHPDVQPFVFHGQDLTRYFGACKETLPYKLPSTHVMLGLLEVSIFSWAHHSVWKKQPGTIETSCSSTA